MRLYNSLTRKVEEFSPGPKQNRVNLFVCGPTVYDYSHIGHARTYLVYDALVKFMRGRLGWDVTYLQNITDLEDKIIRRAAEQKKDPLELAKELTQAHYDDMEALHIDAVDSYAPAINFIPEIISQVERLMTKKHAYIIPADGVYFDVGTFPSYGKLSGRTAQMAEDSVSRIDESVAKKHKADFCLWKFSKENEPSWPASFGEGRPGWHIEDTAIAEKYFGFTYDIHGGGLDLIFPHHEAEIAQMESLSGVPMVKMWTHIGMLTINGEKMAKSTGNFITIRNFLETSSPEVLRMFVFSGHYRSPLDYTQRNIAEASARQKRLQELYNKLGAVSDESSPFPVSDFIRDFWKALKDDFNTPKALSILFELVGEANKCIDAHKLSYTDAQLIRSELLAINAIFGIFETETELPQPHIEKLVTEREAARTSGNFAEADRLRTRIEKEGYIVQDTPNGPRLRKTA